MEKDREHRFEGSTGFWFLRGGNQLSAKDPRTADEIASVGFFTGACNVVVFIGPWDEAEARFEQEVADAIRRIEAVESKICYECGAPADSNTVDYACRDCAQRAQQQLDQ